MHNLGEVGAQSQLEAELSQRRLAEEVTDIEYKLAGAKERQKDLRIGNARPRNQSRRQNPARDLRREAMQEIESFVFTLEFKLKQKREQLAVANREVERWRRNTGRR